MPLLACGINHHTAPLTIREKVVFSPELMPEPLLDLLSRSHASEVAILSTCNRTELYCASNDPATVIDWLHSRQQLTPGELNPYLYLHQGQAAVHHLLRVASGLDSMVLGEPQILGQLKAAFSLAQTAGTLGAHLRRLSQYVFSVAKQVRSETAIGMHPVSIAFAAVNLARHIFADLSKLKVLLIGAGETIELMMRHLQSAGVQHFYVANRTLARAEQLAQQFNGTGIALSAITEYLPQADMVVTATASTLPILGKGAVERALKIRKRRPICMIDFAVPRDIEPEISQLADVYLYTLDDLQTIIQQNQSHRRDAADKAESLVAAQAEQYMDNLKLLANVPAICAYRAQAEEVRDIELAKALRALELGTAPQEVVQRLAQSLTNKILHTPTLKLREK